MKKVKKKKTQKRPSDKIRDTRQKKNISEQITESEITKEHFKTITHSKKDTTKIFIIGESPLVEQYAELCASHGYSVYISWNNKEAEKQKPNLPNVRIVQAIPTNTSLAIELTNIDLKTKEKNLMKIDEVLAETAPILSSSITITATEQCSWINHKHRLIGISALPAFTNKALVEIAPTIFSPKGTIEVIRRFYNSIGKEIEIVQDRIGMVFPRIICQIINESLFLVTEDIATPQDIDKVVTQGEKFPYGPFELAEKIGFDQIYAVLKALQNDLNEERYRIAPILKQMAITGKWWKIENN